MAAISSAASGNWNATGTWTGGVVPGDGDTVSIGAHTVTVTAPVTVGNDSATYAITLTGSGATVHAVADMTIKGAGVRMNNNNSKFLVDTVGSAVTITLASGTVGSIIWAPGGFTGRLVRFVGTATERVTIRGTRTGAAVSQLSDASSSTAQSPVWYMRYVTVDALGGASASVAFANLKQVDWEDCLIKSCGRCVIGTTAASLDYLFKINRCDWREPVGDAWITYNNSSDIATQTRTFTNCTVAGSVSRTGYLQAPDVTVTNFVSANCALYTYQNNNDGKRQRWSKVAFLANSGYSDELMYTPPGADNRYDEIVLSRYYATSQNVHTLRDNTGAALGIAANRFTNSFVDLWNNGNGITSDTILNNGDWIIDSNICIGQFGNLFDGFHGSAGAVTARHNTCINANGSGLTSANQGAMVIAEAYASATKATAIQSNLFVDCLQGVCQGSNVGYTNWQWVPQSNFTLDYNAAYNMLDNRNFNTADGLTNTYLYGPTPTTRTLAASVATSGTNATTLVIATGNFITAGVSVGDVVYKGTGLTIVGAIVTAVNSQTSLTLGRCLTTIGATGISGLTSGDSITIGLNYWADGGTYGDNGKGQHDVFANPNFVDGTRSTSSWDASLGGAGTAANVIEKMIAMNGWDAAGAATTFDANYTIDNLLAYIRAGYTPTNTALKATAHDGGDIGAVAVYNALPVVSAGSDASVAINALPTTLTATATDTDALTYAWTKVSGPGTVTFGTASTLSTTVDFSATGVYVLRFTATDTGAQAVADDVTITVTAASSPSRKRAMRVSLGLGL